MSRPGIYRNRGAPWRRPDGTIIGKGDEFVPTDEERLRRAYKLEYVGPAPETQPTEYPRDLGGGWWELPNGRKVQSEEAARAMMAEDGED